MSDELTQEQWLKVMLDDVVRELLSADTEDLEYSIYNKAKAYDAVVKRLGDNYEMKLLSKQAPRTT